MIDDISIQGEFFDADFFVYREDADVAWRAQLMGWKCLYAPYARGYHVRKALPGKGAHREFPVLRDQQGRRAQREQWEAQGRRVRRE